MIERLAQDVFRAPKRVNYRDKATEGNACALDRMERIETLVDVGLPHLPVIWWSWDLRPCGHCKILLLAFAYRKLRGLHWYLCHTEVPSKKLKDVAFEKVFIE